jgi:RNA-splicing ligase RtcB
MQEIGVIVAVLAILILPIYIAFVRQRNFHNAKQEYARALAALTQDSENVTKRTAALNAGRKFAGMARQRAGQKGRAIFDEVALQNDLNARTGKAATPVPAAPGQTDRADQLSKLAALHEKGLLSKEEFDREKRRLLES